jgi:hypothetical protein
MRCGWASRWPVWSGSRRDAGGITANATSATAPHQPHFDSAALLWQPGSRPAEGRVGTPLLPGKARGCRFPTLLSGYIHGSGRGKLETFIGIAAERSCAGLVDDRISVRQPCALRDRSDRALPHRVDAPLDVDKTARITESVRCDDVLPVIAHLDEPALRSYRAGSSGLEAERWARGGRKFVPDRSSETRSHWGGSDRV